MEENLEPRFDFRVVSSRTGTLWLPHDKYSTQINPERFS
jgi:hypothetical protein